MKKKLRLLSWNINGIRAIYKKGFADWLRDEYPDVLCVQETKARAEQAPVALRETDGYHVYFCAGQRPGYSGVATWTRQEPARVDYGFGVEPFDVEGRTLVCAFDDFLLYNVYFPNGGANPERLAYKLAFYDAFLKHLRRVQRQHPAIVVCGDVNTAHREIDLARPKENEAVSGFLPEERAWIDRLLAAGFHDTFRLQNDEPGHYSWWDYKTRARERNVGWRIDYFFVTEGLAGKVEDCVIQADVTGSDHCPVELKLKV